MCSVLPPHPGRIPSATLDDTDPELQPGRALRANRPDFVKPAACTLGSAALHHGSDVFV